MTLWELQERLDHLLDIRERLALRIATHPDERVREFSVEMFVAIGRPIRDVEAAMEHLREVERVCH